uniref:NADH-ubiquinone oxidoreductase chain 6 n=1 Tax=Morchella brunnea TaxID=1174671 RepID=A0A8K1MIE9_9PEZI|nr:NADH dehydrogenase subunit 6 [Morchella brunnea]UBU98402.1 NADH dehydrogenase subunit 6 [Morchella brunnea]
MLNLINFNSLAVFSEALTNGYQPVALDIITLLSILSGIFVIITKNPVTSVVFLISLFVNIACYLFLIGMHFLGLSYLLVYVGAISMLFLFTIMLINVRTADLYSSSSNSIPLGFIVSLTFFYPVYSILPLATNDKDVRAVDISFVSSSKWDTALSQVSDISSLGNLLYTSHAIWLILASIILLLAMVGAIVITKDSRTENLGFASRPLRGRDAS